LQTRLEAEITFNLEPRVPVDMLGVHVTGQQDLQTDVKANVKLHPDKWAGGREIRRKDFHRSRASTT
jgi:hypothetical protein